MKTLNDLVNELQTPVNGISAMERMRLDPAAQFGTPNAPYVGATLLPEMIKTKNQYTETQIRYRSVLANSGTSYSPAVLNPGGRIVGSFDVKFGNTNQADALDAQTYEAILELLMESGSATNADMQALATLLNWYDNAIMAPIRDLNEKQRWDAIIEAKVIRTGANGLSETVNYSNPSGHRVNISGGTVANPAGWYETDGTYDPFNDHFAIRRQLASKGYRAARLLSAFEPWYIFAKNSAIFTRFSGIAVNSSGNLSSIQQVASQNRINDELRNNELPVWEIYDRAYNYRNPSDPNDIISGRFLGRRTDENGNYWPVVMVATTGRDQIIELTPEQEPIRLENLLGYHGIGRVLGQPTPGRVMNTTVADRHPGGLYAEAIQEGLPVITEPEAVCVMKVYEPTT